MRKSGNVLLILGLLLVLGSFGLLGVSQLNISRAAASAAELTQQLEGVLPPTTSGIMDSYSDSEMPALEIDGHDFIGIVNIPAFQRTLPIGSTWDAGTVTSFPCRFWGSAYDGSLILGGADQKGQFDILDQIQNGDRVLITDMTGAEFSYAVKKIYRSRSAQAEILLDEQADLTLFARDARSLEYVIVRCVMG